MKVFLAGGTGVIGRRLIPQLVAAGHEVAATTRFEERASLLRSLGARPLLLNALDADAVTRAVRDFVPDAVMNQLTQLPQKYNPRKLQPWYDRTSRLRTTGTQLLLTAARETGAKRFIYQSMAFMYAAIGPPRGGRGGSDRARRPGAFQLHVSGDDRGGAARPKLGRRDRCCAALRAALRTRHLFQ